MGKLEKEKVIWEKLKLIAKEIEKLEETPEYELKQIFYLIQSYVE